MKLSTGLILVWAISPGGTPEARKSQGEEFNVGNTTFLDFVGDMIKNLIPANIVAMSHMKYRTVYEDDIVFDEPVEGMNMLGVILLVSLINELLNNPLNSFVFQLLSIKKMLLYPV